VQPDVIYVVIARDLAVVVSKFVAASRGFHSVVDTGNELLLPKAAFPY